MFTSTLATLALLTATISTAAVPANLTPRDVGSCTNKHLPIEWYYNLGVMSFCNTFNPSESDPNPKKTITQGEDYVYTVTLGAWDDNQPLNWVYKISVQDIGDGFQAPQDVTYEKCVRKMKEVLSEGQLGNHYCVVDGTQDVLFQGGTTEEVIKPWGKLVFESRKKNE